MPLGTVPMDEAIRTLSVEMANDKDASFVGKTEAEMEVLSKYAVKGRSRAMLGAVLGTTAMAGLWKFSRNQRKVVGAFAMMSGGIFGASYGIISIRRDLFSELLMLPSDKSPFAVRARNILLTKIPDNAFVREMKDKFAHADNDSWNQVETATGISDSKAATRLPPAPRHFDNEISSHVPPITGLNTSRGKKDTNDEQEAFGEPNDSGHRSPFFFGAKPSTDDNAHATPPLSRDPYERYSQESSRPNSDKSLPPLRHDEDDYFFGVPSDDAPAKPTTWEEIRRRAAEQRKFMDIQRSLTKSGTGDDGQEHPLKPYMSSQKMQRSSSSVTRHSSTTALSYEGLLSEEELVVLRAIVAREAGLDELLRCCCSFEEDQSVELLEALVQVRALSLAAVDAIAGWRRRMIQIQPFMWRNLNYLLKMTCDLDFVSKSQLATAAMDGLRLCRRNPFSTIGGMDQSMRALWEVEMPNKEDLSVLLDSASFATSDITIDLPSKIRLAEYFLVYEERRYGTFRRVQAAADHRLKLLVQKEAEYASKERFGAVSES